MNARTEPAEAEPATPARPPVVREPLLSAGVFLVHGPGRQLVAGRTGEAFRDARGVWRSERWPRLPGEGAAQSPPLPGDAPAEGANAHAATVRLPAALAFPVGAGR
ncbi:hypothetical protein GCM10010269_70950 [Streptomyces humidus]|uniref:Uncharacterized protein n=1 Tax=Streptomyces humidus TaxID=52259 RepID=A0A918G715_9ACTN|nr:hypothetical protein [Streptomyces humidus]GGS21923.1 hypothetical protein GCM10010269_70950 [Streptomyces humidus]